MTSLDKPELYNKKLSTIFHDGFEFPCPAQLLRLPYSIELLQVRTQDRTSLC